MVKATFSIVCLTFIVLCAVNCEDCDKLGVLLYEDLGCKPVKKSGKECPVKYECDDFSPPSDSCLFRERKYALSEQIDNDITYEFCNVGCSCNNNMGETKFTCAVLDCPEWLGVPVKPGCYRRYEVNKCCSSGVICPSDDNPAGECTVNGKTYKEGEKFFPKNTCMKCACPKNFNGKLESPHCNRISCGIQINFPEKLHNRCAPCYLKSDDDKNLCCPDTWVCPSSPNEIIKADEGTASNSELTCTFGKNVLNLGQTFERKIDYYGSHRDVKCECIIPPLLTCKEV